MPSKKGAGGKPQEFDKATGEYGHMPSAKRIVGNYERRFGSVTQSKLTKSEWRRYYDIIGGMQNGTIRQYRLKNGSRWIILNVDEEQDGTQTPARLILDNGNYVTPKVKAILTFDNDDELYDFIALQGV